MGMWQMRNLQRAREVVYLYASVYPGLRYYLISISLDVVCIPWLSYALQYCEY